MSIARILPLLLVLTAISRAAEPLHFDICVYGGTSGGVVAAVQAAALGKSVVIVEPGEHLGGMSAGGLGFTDFGKKDAIGGLAREFYRRVGKHYGRDVEFNLEPHVAEKIFEDWVHDDRIHLLRPKPLASVRKQNSKLTEIVTDDGTIVRARVFIDATYEGDLLAMAGISYIVGRESNQQYGETLNGIQGPAKNPRAGKFGVRLDPFVIPNDPTGGLLPLVHGTSRGEIGASDKRVQAYNYRLCLTDDLSNRRELEPSAVYDPKQFELLARLVQARTANGDKLTLSDFLKYDALPNRKFDFNNRWPLSTDFIGGSEKYPEANWRARRGIAREHENYLRDFLHFLATDARVPKAVLEETSRFGLARDEFTSTNNWPHQLYVREARRMVSDFVMREQHCLGEVVASKPVALGSYNIDIHGVRRIFADGVLDNEGSNGAAVIKPYPIGYEALVPRETEATNLLVPFCLSASHVAFGSIRMEPVFMALSQVSATAACIAIDADVTVQQVSYDRLREHLEKDGVVLK
jgi:hypothetical protein